MTISLEAIQAISMIFQDFKIFQASSSYFMLPGFACVDISYAQPGFHGRSFDLEFTQGFGTSKALRLRARSGGECWVMGIQPTERGRQRLGHDIWPTFEPSMGLSSALSLYLCLVISGKRPAASMKC